MKRKKMEKGKMIALVTIVIMAIVAGNVSAEGIDTTGAITVPVPEEEEANPYEHWIEYSDVSNCTAEFAFNATWVSFDGQEFVVNEEIEFELNGGFINETGHYYSVYNNLTTPGHPLVKGGRVYFDSGMNYVTGFWAFYEEEFEDLKVEFSIDGTKQGSFLPRVDYYVRDPKNTTFGWTGQEVYDKCVVSIRAGYKYGDSDLKLKDCTCDNASYISFTFKGRFPELPDDVGKVLYMPADRERQDEYVCSLSCWLPPAVSGVGSGEWWGKQRIEFYNPETRKFINANVVGYGPYLPYAVACLSRNAMEAIGAKENETVLYLVFASPEAEQEAGMVGMENSISVTQNLMPRINYNANAAKGIIDIAKFARC